MSKMINNLVDKNIDYFIIDNKVVSINSKKIDLNTVLSDNIDIVLLQKCMSDEKFLTFAIKHSNDTILVSKTSNIINNVVNDMIVIDNCKTVEITRLIDTIVSTVSYNLDSVFVNEQSYSRLIELLVRYLEKYRISGVNVYDNKIDNVVFVGTNSNIKFSQIGKIGIYSTSYDEFIAYLDYIVKSSDSKIIELCNVVKENFPDNIKEIILENEKLRKECSSKTITINELISKNTDDKNKVIQLMLREEVLKIKESIKESMVSELKIDLSTVNKALKDEILLFKDIVKEEVKDINGHIDIFKTDIYKKMSTQITDLNNELLVLKNENNAITRKYNYLESTHNDMVFIDTNLVSLIADIHNCLKDVFAVIDTKLYSSELTYQTYIGELSGIRNNIFNKINEIIVNRKNKTLSKTDVLNIVEFFNNEIKDLMEIKEELSKLNNKDGSSNEYKAISGGLLSRVKNFVDEKINNKINREENKNV